MEFLKSSMLERLAWATGQVAPVVLIFDIIYRGVYNYIIYSSSTMKMNPKCNSGFPHNLSMKLFEIQEAAHFVWYFTMALPYPFGYTWLLFKAFDPHLSWGDVDVDREASRKNTLLSKLQSEAQISHKE